MDPIVVRKEKKNGHCAGVSLSPTSRYIKIESQEDRVHVLSEKGQE
jgi:hypothetical protein